MKKLAGILVCSVAVLVLTAAAASSRSTKRSYAEDRAAIEDLQARYMQSTIVAQERNFRAEANFEWWVGPVSGRRVYQPAD